MCGRVRLSSDYSEIKIKLKFAPDSVAPNFEADWNKPPTAPMLVAIRSEDGKRTPKMMKWGLIPHWSKDDKLQYSTFNARSEDFRTKPSFREPWKWGQRCLVVTDGFYEWKKLDPKGKEKQPYAIAMTGDAQMIMTNTAILALSKNGVPIKQIVRQTGHSRKLARQVIRGERNDVFRTRQSSLDVHLPWLDDQWASGCRNGAELWRRLTV